MNTALATYPTYDAYRPSGIDWLGDIPAHWEVKKLKYVVSKVGSGVTPSGGANTYQDDGIPLLRSQNIHNNGLKLDDVAFISKEVHESMSNSKVSNGDVLLNITGASIGRVYYYNGQLGEANVNQHVCIIRPDFKSIYTKHLTSILQSRLGQDQIQAAQNGASREGLTFQDLRNFDLLIPPLAEQAAIANYLDRKTAQIDALITRKEKLIQLLTARRQAIINEAVTGQNAAGPKKASGIAWLGEIPAYWEVKKLKYISETISKGTTPSTEGKGFTDEGIRFIKAENIVENKVEPSPEFFIDEETNELLRRSKLQENDLLIVIAGATIGKCALLSNDFLPANTNQAVCFIRLLNGYSPKFMSFVLSSTYIQSFIWYAAVQSAQPNLSMGELGNFPILVPPINEQDTILEYLEEVGTTYTGTITKLRNQIETLRAYRASVITEVVTGQRRVV